MSLPDEEARALDEAFKLLCDLSSGAEKRIPSATRQRARDVLRHYPLAVISGNSDAAIPGSPTDRCSGCDMNRVYCEGTREMQSQACCESCDHEGDE